ncbi:MFS transporter [Novosphingobium sp. FSY-8]|uniref:MFS transporter n=1 Tax=Novosphingobium ovatum TaxID=1908523 RepID=A0ABW9XHZ2_9SPHN|nr:MFS transporter [Novosphingobium ovatum]NBC38182.1 MFS transporter [Novosphingobium ovatum]
MGWRQIAAIALCCALNALDGFDVLSISFASPGIAAEWGIDRKALGIVLSMEIFGMAVGSVMLGQLADRIGRMYTALISLIIMLVGMIATPHSTDVGMLAGLRLFTGLGIGGMLAATNALTAEYANAKWRNAAIALMAAGYPLGAVVGGSIAREMLVSGGWRDVFYLGAGLAIILLPLVPWLLPEPVGALMQRRPANALQQVNRTLRIFGHEQVDHLPPAESQIKGSVTQLFTKGLLPITILLTVAYFMHILTFYFIVKWIPKVVVDMGFPASAAAGVLVWTNVGGLIGAVLFSLSSLRLPLRPALVGAMLLSSIMVAVFGQSPADLKVLSIAAGVAAFFTNGVIVGFYALIAQSFPTALRGSGTGFVIGIGRAGAAAGPIIAGFLFEAKLGLPMVAIAMALGSLTAAVTLIVMPKRDAHGH